MKNLLIVVVVVIVLIGCDATKTTYYDQEQNKVKEKYTVKEVDGNIVKDGTYTSYHSNGMKKEVLIYKNGKLDGKCLSYGPNGVKSVEMNFVDGKPDGEGTIIFYDSGEVAKVAYWDKGKPVGTWKEYSYETEKIENVPAGSFKIYIGPGGY